MGWQEPIKRNKTRLDFACMVTHAHGNNKTGSKACAPLIRYILDSL